MLLSSTLLFVLVMDCLARIMDKAHRAKILSPLGPQQVKFKASLYADDVTVFLKPQLHDMDATSQIMKLFGLAPGLHTNFQKSSFYPIRCEGIDLQALQATLGCQLAQLPCKYL